MKRHIAIPLLCVVLVAALSIPVFAVLDLPNFPYPENNVSGTGLVRITSNEYPSCVYSESIPFGSLFLGSFVDPTNEIANFNCNLSFSLTVYVESYLFIAIPYHYIAAGYDFGELSQYRYSEHDYSVNFGNNYPVSIFTMDSSHTAFTRSDGRCFTKVNFLCFADVPPGVYSVNIHAFGSQELGPVGFGVYATKGNMYNFIIGEAVSGSVSYVDAIDQIMDVYESTQSPDIDVHQRTINAIELTNTLERLNMSMSSVAAQNASALSSKMGSTVDQFANGEINLSNAMSSLSSDFSSALSGAQTVDEAQAVTAVYQANLKKLEVRNEIQMMQVFDDAMTDEEFQQIQDYYAAEEELVNAFDVAEFESQLQLDNWFLLLNQTEAFNYKRFFDYLLNDSDIRYFIIIPLTMGLVSIIMGTTMRVRPSSRGNNDD